MQQERHNILKRFFNYIGNKLTDKERHTLERDAMKHPFDEDALEGFSNYEYDDVVGDLNEIEQKLFAKKEDNKRFFYLKIAAGIFIVFSVSTLLYYFIETRQTGEIAQQIDTTYNKESVVSPELDTLERKPIEENTPKSELFTKQNTKSKEKEAVSAAEVKRKKVETSKKIQNIEIAEVKKDEELLEVSKEEDNFLSMEQNMFMDETSKEENIEIKSGLAATSPVEGNLQGRMQTSSGKKTYVSKQKDSRVVSGTVVDQQGNPIPGVTITIKGTAIGTVTDLNGNFKINNYNIDVIDTIDVSFIGYEPIEVDIQKDKENLNIRLEPDLLALEEVVVVGYGVTKKSDLTAAISSVTAEELTSKPVSNTENSCYPSPYIGYLAYRKYIKESISFPENINRIDDNVKVKLSFRVSSDSIPQQIRAISSPDEQYSKIAIELLKNGPKWVPCPNNLSKEVTYTVKFKE